MGFSENNLRINLSKLYSRLLKIIHPLSEEIGHLTNAYDNAVFQDYIARKTKIYIEGISGDSIRVTDARKIAALSFVTRDEIANVVEIGGGAGIDFFTALKIFGAKQNWMILETEAMCSAMRDSGIDHPLLKCVSKLPEKHSVKHYSSSALYLNASLQYLKDPESTLKELLNHVEPEVIAMIRIPLCMGVDEVSYLQKSRIKENGPQIEGVTTDNIEICCDVTIISQERMRSLLQKAGYSVLLEESTETNFGREAKTNNVGIREFMYLARRQRQI